MNGAQALIRTLVDAGVNVCFANPGTSEMHFVAALDQVPEMRGVLCLFEGVATAAADGYARISGRPAATLLHLGPGLGNGFANLHNARRAQVPLINVVGDHASHHKQYDAPLESDIEALAWACSGWVRRSAGPKSVATDAADAVAAASSGRGRIATLILPADACWLEATGPVAPRPASPAPAVDAVRVAELAARLRASQPALMLLGGRSLRERGLRAAARVAAATGARLLGETFPARLERGAGLPPLDRLAYLAEHAQAQLAGLRLLVAIDAAAPVSFFAYPGKASTLSPADCRVELVGGDAEDPVAVLEALAAALGAPTDVPVAPARVPPRPSGTLNAETLAQGIAALLPANTIVVDEANTSGVYLPAYTAGAPRHDWLALTGGSIGIGLPLAVGAALAKPDARVLCLEADGSAMYTPQALWTMAREGLDVTTVILANRSYAILNLELMRVGAGAGGAQARDMLDLTRPTLDFVALAQGMGVTASRATNCEELCTQLERSFATRGPSLIEAVLPPLQMPG